LKDNIENKRTLGVIIDEGFHSFKKYVLSDFVHKLSRDFNIIFISHKIHSDVINKFLVKTGFSILYIDHFDYVQSQKKIEIYNRSVRDSWMINNEFGSFHNYRKINKKNLKSLLIGNEYFKIILEKITLFYNKNVYYDFLLSKIFKDYSITDILSTNSLSTFSKVTMITANREKLKTWFLINSWKDLYVNNFLSFDFLDGLFVWDKKMKKDYISHMSYLNPKKIYVTGNPTFDIYLKDTSIKNKTYYSEKYNINHKAKWVLFSMMPPGLYNNEINIVKFIGFHLLKHFSEQELVIIVRKNPNHDENDFVNQDIPKNTRIADHYCTYDKDTGIIVQSIEGEEEWVDLVKISDMNISVPSTVTNEFLLFNKTVLNIAFDEHGEPNEKITQHFESGFYKPLFTSNHNVIKCNTINDLLDNIKRLMISKIHKKSGPLFSSSGDKICDIIKN
jgi:hypothetical protein